MPRKNVYAGKHSTAKIPVKGKVDSFREIVAIAYALTYDLKDKLLLTRTRKVVKATPQRINGRFKVLYLLAEKYSKRAKGVITKFHKLANLYLHNKINRFEFLARAREIAQAYLPPTDIMIIEMHVSRAEGWKYV